jgi:hypothetical protein
MVSTGATSVSHAASVYHPHLLPPSSVAYPGISPIRLAEASPPPHSMPIEQSQYHRRCERVSPIRFKLTGAALHLGVTAATHVRRAAKLKTLCIDRDRGTPHGAAPPTPPGKRVTYHGGSIELSRDGNIKSGEADRIEVVVAQGRVDRRMP